jgi:hypothetical protein
MTSKLWGKAAIALVLMVGFSGLAFAQAAQSNLAQIDLTAHLNESITVNINSGTDIDFVLQPNTAVNAGSLGSSITTAWVLKPSRGTVAVWAYFGSAAAALSGTAGNAVTIPSSAVKIQVGGGAAPFAAMTTVSPFNATASGLLIGSTNILGTNRNSSRTDVLAYQIDTTVVPQLPADDYAGVMNVQAQAQ